MKCSKTHKVLKKFISRNVANLESDAERYKTKEGCQTPPVSPAGSRLVNPLIFESAPPSVKRKDDSVTPSAEPGTQRAEPRAMEDYSQVREPN